MTEQLTIGKLAEETGLSRKSIRYYESQGLIPKAGRSLAGYRLYSPEVIHRMKFIQKAKSIGFSLDEIRQLLDLTRHGKPCCDHVFRWSEHKLSELDQQIKFLQDLRARLSDYQEKWKDQSTAEGMPDAEICGLIESVELEEVSL